jgi:hypothetical protein
MAYKSTLAPGEDYATAGDLLATEDLHEDTLRIWDLPIRVRGLTLVEREEIRASAWRSDGQRDQVKLVKGYLQHGIVTPRMNDEQVDRFVRKHAWAVEAVYLYIDRLTEMDYDVILAIAKAAAGLAPGAEPADAPGAGSADDRPMDRPAGDSGGDAPPGVSQDDPQPRAARTRGRKADRQQ